jgi:hypothetical protein
VTNNRCELRERVRDVMHDVYIVRREKVSGSLQVMFMGYSGGSGGISEVCNSVSHLSLTGRI